MGWWLEWSGTSLILACAKPYSQKETKPFEKLKESWNARCSENCSEHYYRICEHQFTVNIIDTPLLLFKSTYAYHKVCIITRKSDLKNNM